MIRFCEFNLWPLEVKGDRVQFRITFPEEGQYGLDIYTREGGSPASNSDRFGLALGRRLEKLLR